MEDFIYWRHPTVPGIKVEEIFGGKAGKAGNAALWREMACQVYCENGRDGYREIGHFHNGAPFVAGSDARISLSHDDGLYVVATLPETPESDLSEFSERAALGVDAERADRRQVLAVREKFLSERELEMIPAGDVRANVIAWTAKEAVYKAAMREGLDLRRDIRIDTMPGLSPATPVFDKEEFPEISYGSATLTAGGKEIPLILYTYESDTDTGEEQPEATTGAVHIVTLAYSPRSAKFAKASHR